MSKQYLAQHTIDGAHRIDIYALGCTANQVISASGESSIKIHSTTSADFPIAQVLKAAHKLGCHHLALSADGKRLVSVGFGGEAKIWRFEDDIWKEAGEITDLVPSSAAKKLKAGEIWGVCLSAEGQYLAGTTYDGRINVWDMLDVDESTKSPKKIRQFETKGSFGMAIDMDPDGKLTATGHESGSLYVFSNATSRLLFSLPPLIQPVRAVKFSPGGTLIAAAGDSRILALYSASSGEQIAQLMGHNAWITCLDWSNTGEYLVTGDLGGKVKVWSVERRDCVATMTMSGGEGDGDAKPVWGVKWLPKGPGERSERFAVAGGDGSIAIYREASGG